MVIVDIITAIFGGGVTGIIGTITTAIINYKTQKIKNEHERDLERIKIDAMKVKAEIAVNAIKSASKEIVEVIDKETEAIDAAAYAKSIEYGNQNSFGSAWIEKLLAVKGWTSWISFPIAFIIIILFGINDFLKGIIRPGITFYMMAASTWVTFLAYDILDTAGMEKIPIDKAVEIFNNAVVVITYLTISCVTWWFADRRTAKFLMRLNDGNLKIPSATAAKKVPKEIEEDGDDMPHKS